MYECDFTYQWYERLLDLIHNNNYIIANYLNYKNIDRPCILRHDVDMDINKASEFAVYENKFLKGEGYKGSTYFLLVSSDFYNIFSKNSLVAADKILSLGNEIGLHFDELKYDFKQSANLFSEFVEQELDLLGRALGIRIQVVSMHRPSMFTLENNLKFNSAINSYSQEFFKDFKYISDSRMNWREDAYTVIKNNEYNRLHLLTHPIWYNKLQNSTKDVLLNFINQANKERYYNLSSNFRDLEEYVSPEEAL